jgi:membrane associated rhomboid family serine protease
MLVFLAEMVMQNKIITIGGSRFWGRDLIVSILAMRPILVMHGWVWTFISYMFVHGGVSHILFNMLALFIFGTQVERRMGSREFLLFYLLTGALAGVFSFLVYMATGAWGVALMGASGAIFAVQLAFAVFFPDAIIYIWGIIPLRAPIMVLAATALELFSTISGRGGNVAHFTHLAGFGMAWLYFRARLGISPWKRLTGR